MFFNSEGWPVVAPFRYAPLSLATPAQVAEVTAAQAAGAYKMVNHGKDITATIKNSENLRLNSDGTVSGAVTGTWIHRGNNLVDVDAVRDHLLRRALAAVEYQRQQLRHHLHRAEHRRHLPLGLPHRGLMGTFLIC